MADTLPVQIHDFQPVELEKIRDVLQENLKKFYAEVSVTISDCPDLTEEPYNLAAEGFGGGSTGIVDLGGVPYLLPLVNRSKVYDLRTVASKCIGSNNFPDGWYFSGAGAGPWPTHGSNCEMVLSMKIGPDGELVKNCSKLAFTSSGDEKDVQLKELGADTKCALLANFMVSSGVRGKVLEVKCSHRTDSKTDFTSSLRAALDTSFPSQPVGLGGLFLVKKAASKIHIMRDFSETPLLTEEAVDNWLKFFDMDPPMLFQSILVSSDPGLDLRIDHSHGWSLNPDKNEGGHYHYDMAPNDVEYHGFYAVAQKLWRIDRPPSN